MRKTKIKICGLMGGEDVSYVNIVHPDYVGFVFAQSKRRVSEELAAKLAAELDSGIIRVGVFVDEEADRVVELLKKDIIQIAQLHGGESPDEIRYIQQRSGRQVIKAIQVRTAADVAAGMDSPADILLLDSGKGSGEAFDWDCLRAASRPFLLAGGLTPENVGEAVMEISPFGVDVSSGVETNGRKDFFKIHDFMEAVTKGDKRK
ncbi:MAG: phosphoribosylanthranilate isomerase [Hespellia sp.]|nr:phosphoribosylanthranilate isomerase [Hespellia sp.]